MNLNGIFGAVLAIAVVGNTDARDIVLDQPHDFRDFLASEEGTAIPFARTADDFMIDTIFLVPRFRAQMIVSFPNTPASFRFQIFDDAGGRPGNLLLDGDFGFVTDFGPWNGNPNLHLFELDSDRVDFARYGKRGRQWFSPYAVGNGSGEDRGWWGTSGNGQIDGSQAYFMSEHFGVPDGRP